MDNQDNRFIELLKQKKKLVVEEVIPLADVIQSLKSVFGRYYASDNTFVKKIQLLGQYTQNLIHTKKESLPLLDRCNTTDIAEDLRSVIDSAIEEVTVLGLPKTTLQNPPQNPPQAIINNTLSQSQNQSQDMNLVVSVLLEAAQDELTGKQRKELLAIAEETKDAKEAHKSILSKLKEFGEELSANIVANILTNPLVWQNIGSLL